MMGQCCTQRKPWDECPFGNRSCLVREELTVCSQQRRIHAGVHHVSMVSDKGLWGRRREGWGGVWGGWRRAGESGGHASVQPPPLCTPAMVTVNPATHACAQNLLPCFLVLKEVYLGTQRRIAYMQDGVLNKFFSTRACENVEYKIAIRPSKHLPLTCRTITMWYHLHARNAILYFLGKGH